MYKKLLLTILLSLKYRFRQSAWIFSILTIYLISSVPHEINAQSFVTKKDSLDPTPPDSLASVVAIDLINAETYEVVQTLASGDVIDLRQYDFELDLMARLNIDLDSTKDRIIVGFELKGENLVKNTKTSAPFVLCGNQQIFSFNDFRPGEYYLKATPYVTSPNVPSVEGIALSLKFFICRQLDPTSSTCGYQLFGGDSNRFD